MFPFIQVLIALVVVSVAYLWISWKRVERKLKWIPKVPGHPIFGNVMDFGKTTDTLRVLSSYVNQFSGVCTVDLIVKKLIVITDLKLIEFILISTKILDKSSEYRFLERWLGDGILIARAARWRKSRKIITPAFHFGILSQFVSTYESNADIMVKLLEKEIGKGSFDIYEYVTMCTLDIIYDGKILPKRTTLFIYIYGIHKDPAIFPDPEKFDPMRFDNTSKTSPFIHLPFSAGMTTRSKEKSLML